MEKVFELFIAEEGDGHSEAWAKLWVPAPPWAVRDAIEKAQIRQGRPVSIEVQKYAPELEFLRSYMGTERELSGMYAFNAVAKLLADMDPAQYPTLRERLRENISGDGGTMSPARLYDLAANGTLFHTLGLPSASLDYTVLLELRPAYGTGNPVLLKMPATEDQFQTAIAGTGAEDGAGTAFRCVDCKVPGLMDAITAADDYRAVNEAAKRMETAPPKTLLKYKAVLEALGVSSLPEAMALYDKLDGYALEADVRCTEDAAKWELRFLLDETQAKKLIPHVNLLTFGQTVIEDYGLTLTSYGAVSHVGEATVQRRESIPAEKRQKAT